MRRTGSDGSESASRTPPRRAADLWWLQPWVIVMLLLTPIYLSALTFDFKRVVPNVYVPSPLYGFGLLLILAVGVGAQWALAQKIQGPVRQPPSISLTCMMALLIPTVLAYFLWFGPLLTQPHLLMEVASGKRGELRDSLSTIPGVTTLTQFGVAYVIAYAIKAGAGRDRLTLIERAGLVLIFALAILRAFAWAERLAVIELLLCFTVTRMAYLPLHSRRSWLAASVLPAMAPFILYGLFTASEYFRSWEYYKHAYDTVWAFTLDRLITYYATAINNGIGVLTELDGWPLYSGAFTFDWAWLLPGVSKILEGAIENPWIKYHEFLDTYGRPEFNSPTAYFRLMVDFGYIGTLIYFLAIGYICGRSYIGFRRGHVFGLLSYSVLLLFLMESLRYSYFGEPRMVPLTLGLTMVALDIVRNRRVRGR